MDQAQENYNRYNPASNLPLFKAAGKKPLIIGAVSLFSLWCLYIFRSLAGNSFSDTSLPQPVFTNTSCAATTSAPAVPPTSPFNESKVALFIEDRPIPHLAPLLLHMISVVPEDWKFRFVSSEESITFLNKSLGVQRQVARGKLDMVLLPSKYSVKGQEPLSRTMTDLSFWKWVGGKATWDWRDPYTDDIITGPDGEETRRPQVEWVLVFQTDSILCANSGVSLNSWLEWDWVGAPWDDKYGGNGGLSLRRLTRIIQVLETQQRPFDDRAFEDVWLVERIGILPGARMARSTIESEFSVERIWGEEPMGYHIGWGGELLMEDVWNEKEKQEKIWKWCPEIKLILNMILERDGCPDLQKSRLKARSEDGSWRGRLRAF